MEVPGLTPPIWQKICINLIKTVYSILNLNPRMRKWQSKSFSGIPARGWQTGLTTCPPPLSAGGGGAPMGVKFCQVA